MRNITFIFGLLFSMSVYAEEIPTDEQLCLDYVKAEGNYKSAHTNKNCINAAEAGNGSAQYSVGMGYGFAGDSEKEEIYYRLAAKQNITAAYLALGHKIKGTNQEEAIYWYERYVESKSEGYGYAALQLAKIYRGRHSAKESEKWLHICKSSPYKDSCEL